MVRCVAVVVPIALLGAPSAAAELWHAGSFPLQDPPGAKSAAADVAAGADGSVYVLNLGYVQKYDPQGALLATWGGYGSAPGQFVPPAQSYRPGATALAVDAERVYVTDGAGNRVVVFTTGGAFVETWGRGDSQPAHEPGSFDLPDDIAVEPAGSVLVVDRSDYRFGPGALQHQPAIQRLAPDGTPLVRRSMGDAEAAIDDVSVGPDGAIYARTWLDRLDRLEPATLLRTGGFELAAPHPYGYKVQPPSCCAVATLGNEIWVGRSHFGQLEAYASDGRLIAACGDGPANPSASTVSAPGVLTTGHDGALYALEGGRVLRFRAQPAGGERCDGRPPRLTMSLTQRRLRVDGYRYLRKAYASFARSAPAVVELTFTQLLPGGRRVRRATLRGIDRDRYRLVDGLSDKRLPAGRYELSAVATDRFGVRSAPARTRIGVTRRRSGS